MKPPPNKPRTWPCEHIKFWSRPAQKNVATCFGVEDFPAASGYYLKDTGLPCGIDATNWQLCPICGARRPGSKKRLK